jgi:hypothetical protein
VTEIVYVTNIGEKPLTDGWDGVQYAFLPGKTVEVPVFVAGHIFGYGFEDKTEHVVRLGWAKTTNDIPGALANLENFVISTESPEVRRSVPPGKADSAQPLPVASQGRRERGAAPGQTITIQ